jgi:DNA-binding NarL/FixJ family response regulator
VRVNVFVVEDSAAMRQRLIAALEEVPGARVVGWAEGADEAMTAITCLRPRLVVLDLRLALGSGLSVLEGIKRIEAPPVVAILTNYPHAPYRARCAELGADYFFDKAAGLDGLMDACRAIVAGGSGAASRGR